jgi:hypothetical protein
MEAKMKTALKVILFILLAISLFTGLAAMEDNYNQRQSQFVEHTDGPAMRAAEKEALRK